MKARQDGAANGQPAATVTVSRTAPAWQAEIATLPMPVRLVHVNGRAGVVTVGGGQADAQLRLGSEDGAQVSIVARSSSQALSPGNTLAEVSGGDLPKTSATQ